MTVRHLAYKALAFVAALAFWASLAASAHAEVVEPSIPPSVDIAAPPMPGSPGSAAEESGHAAGGVGFPQLDPSTYASQVFWLMVAFVLLYVLMSKTALPKIESVIENRREQREGNLTRAEQFRVEAEKIRGAYEQSLARAHEDAQRVLFEAEGEIKEISMARSSAFAENARKRIALSEETIAKAKQAALASVADIAADIAVEASAKVAHYGANKADVKKTIQSVMKESA